MTDKQVLGIARGGGLNLLGQVCSQVAMLVVTVLLARQLGREDVGRYAQASAILSLLGLVSLSGLRTGLTRFVAVHLAEWEAGALRGTVRLSIALTTGAAALLGLALYLAAPGLAHGAFHDQGLALPLQVVALVLPAATFTDSALAATQGFRTMKPFALVGLVFEPLLRVGLSAALIAGGAGLGGALAAMAVSNLAAAAAAAWALRRLLRRVAQAAPTRARLRELLGFSLLSWGASLASSGLVWADTILIGALRSSAEVGVYNVATRLVTLATFVMPAINGGLGPSIANLHHRHQTESLRRAYAVATSWILRLSMPVFVVLLAFPSQLLRTDTEHVGAAAVEHGRQPRRARPERGAEPLAEPDPRHPRRGHGLGTGAGDREPRQGGAGLVHHADAAVRPGRAQGRAGGGRGARRRPAGAAMGGHGGHPAGDRAGPGPGRRRVPGAAGRARDRCGGPPGDAHPAEPGARRRGRGADPLTRGSCLGLPPEWITRSGGRGRRRARPGARAARCSGRGCAGRGRAAAAGCPSARRRGRPAPGARPPRGTRTACPWSAPGRPPCGRSSTGSRPRGGPAPARSRAGCGRTRTAPLRPPVTRARSRSWPAAPGSPPRAPAPASGGGLLPWRSRAGP